MKVETLKQITVNEIKEKIQSKISKYETFNDIFENVLDVLVSFEGKKPTKRIRTAVKKKLQKYSVYFEKSEYFPNRTDLTIWGNGLDFTDRLKIDLSNNEFELINLNNIKNCNQWAYYHWEKRLKHSLALDRAEQFVKQYENAQKQINVLQNNLEEHDVSYIFSDY
mgnify:CR=1 FL=1